MKTNNFIIGLLFTVFACNKNPQSKNLKVEQVEKAFNFTTSDARNMEILDELGFNNSDELTSAITSYNNNRIKKAPGLSLKNDLTNELPTQRKMNQDYGRKIIKMVYEPNPIFKGQLVKFQEEKISIFMNEDDQKKYIKDCIAPYRTIKEEEKENKTKGKSKYETIKKIGGVFLTSIAGMVIGGIAGAAIGSALGPVGMIPGAVFGAFFGGAQGGVLLGSFIGTCYFFRKEIKKKFVSLKSRIKNIFSSKNK